MSLVADTVILEELKEMRAEHARFRREVMAELADLRRAVAAQPPVAAPKPVTTANRLPKFMTAPAMGEQR